MSIEGKSLAQLRNVTALDTAIMAAQRRQPHLPGLVPFYGPSGYGKSSAAAFCANKHRAYYVQVQVTWNDRMLLSQILAEMGIAAEKTAAAMAGQVAEQLAKSGRPLIVDEFDYLVERGRGVDLIRDLHDNSAGGVIVAIGEERLPVRLRRYERFHGRVHEWLQAQPADARDAASLAKLYCDGLGVAEDLAAHLARQANGSVRRICVNLARIQAFATKEGLKKIGLAEWGNRELYTGDAPARTTAKAAA